MLDKKEHGILLVYVDYVDMITIQKFHRALTGIIYLGDDIRGFWGR